MQPSIYHIEIREGSKFERTFELLTDGSPRDLTGYTAELQVWSASRPDPILTCNSTNNRLSIDALEGKINVTIGATTALTNAGLYRYVVVITPSNEDDAERVIEGDCTIFLNSVNTY